MGNGYALTTACPHSRASRPPIPQDPQPIALHEEKALAQDLEPASPVPQDRGSFNTDSSSAYSSVTLPLQAHFGIGLGCATLLEVRGKLNGRVFLFFLFIENLLLILWSSWARGARVGAGGGQRGGVVHGLSPRSAGRVPVRRTRPRTPQDRGWRLPPARWYAGWSIVERERLAIATAVAAPDQAASGVAWPMARNNASRARLARMFASRSVMARARASKALKVTPGRKYRAASGNDFSFSYGVMTS